MEGQLARREASAELGDHDRNCVLKHCLYLKIFIPNFVAFFVSLEFVISCVRKMPFSATSAKREFTQAIVSLSISHCPLVRDSEPMRLFEIPTSLSLYMLMIVVTLLISVYYG